MRKLVVLLVMAAGLVSTSSALAWTWPVDGQIVRPFAFGDDPYAAGLHRGVDLAAPVGADVRAPASGVLTFRGFVPSGGLTVTISTSDGYSATLQQLGVIDVAKGSTVVEGSAIGSVGASTDSVTTGSHVHLGVRVTDEKHGYVDPLTLLNRSATEPAGPTEPEAPADTAAAPETETVTQPTPSVAESASRLAPAPAVAAPVEPVPVASPSRPGRVRRSVTPVPEIETPQPLQLEASAPSSSAIPDPPREPRSVPATVEPASELDADVARSASDPVGAVPGSVVTEAGDDQQVSVREAREGLVETSAAAAETPQQFVPSAADTAPATAAAVAQVGPAATTTPAAVTAPAAAEAGSGLTREPTHTPVARRTKVAAASSGSTVRASEPCPGNVAEQAQVVVARAAPVDLSERPTPATAAASRQVAAAATGADGPAVVAQRMDAPQRPESRSAVDSVVSERLSTASRWSSLMAFGAAAAAIAITLLLAVRPGQRRRDVVVDVPSDTEYANVARAGWPPPRRGRCSARGLPHEGSRSRGSAGARRVRRSRRPADHRREASNAGAAGIRSLAERTL